MPEFHWGQEWVYIRPTQNISSDSPLRLRAHRSLRAHWPFRAHWLYRAHWLAANRLSQPALRLCWGRPIERECGSQAHDRRQWTPKKALQYGLGADTFKWLADD